MGSFKYILKCLNLPLSKHSQSYRQLNIPNVFNSLTGISTLLCCKLVKNISSYRSQSQYKFPSGEDLSGAAESLIRLQDTYNLETSDVARGELNGSLSGSLLTSSDCFELGRQALINEDFYFSLLWATEALERYHNENNKTSEMAEILNILAFSLYKKGDIERALEYNEELLKLQPDHKQALENKIAYERTLNEIKDSGGNKDGAGSEEDISESRLMNRYRMSCRNERKIAEDVRAQLKCRYINRGNPYLLLAPFKEEEVFLDPRIVVYHEILTDAEIATLKRLATPRFKRAKVFDAASGKVLPSRDRVGKSAWLNEKMLQDDTVYALNQRVEDFTGLTVSSAESLQVLNYGIGGHYYPHYDFLTMSDVEQGGATVFPNLNVTLFPKKGTAAFWYNLHFSGMGDTRTIHAACPVLIGSKWVCNKWIHEFGQEFRRPCNLKAEPDKISV